MHTILYIFSLLTIIVFLLQKIEEMALEAVVFPLDPFGYGSEELLYSMGGGANIYWVYDFGPQEPDKALQSDNNMSMIEQLTSQSYQDNSSPSQVKGCDLNSSPETCAVVTQLPTTRRRKRRPTKNPKDKQVVEHQRMTHIAVERNRRKLMNEYLAVLASLMPESYVQRGDQASIVGGAINFVKELEQQVQSREAQKRQQVDDPFADFFSFPQYTRRANECNSSPSSCSSTADIEVSMVETHAHLKILSKKQPRQLLKMLAAFQSLRLTVLHLNVTTTQHHMVLYSISLKVEEGSEMNTVDGIAAAVNEMLWRIEVEASAC